ncbi:hypothetical protein GGR32_001996 [Mesonia hippocampi]|uniref:DUF2911 domain-containing protein n=1 Tax=Mesonia hippocampi TaxID=1628250 RepID=A0A840ERU5_9FLAO|nr:DUF2911 domain-containing protein [Mesonia hippocampi]MBB4119690.1 hypothetical protein [Mesonia hippocampi]
MKFKKLLIVILLLGGIGYLAFSMIIDNTKAQSPEGEVNFQKENLRVDISYNRPYKKDRLIFGGLVPYNKVWRTGANEATTFATSRDILIDGSLLKAGKYTLWTIPKENSWKIIFNDRMYAWGIDLSSNEAARNPENDVLIIERPVEKPNKTIEQFTIYFEKDKYLNEMVLTWDDVKIKVPFKEKDRH